MRKVRDISVGPPGGAWLWKCPETGTLLHHQNFIGLRRTVKGYLRDNNFPITGQFEQDFEENVCALLPPQTCEDFTPPSLLEKMTSVGRALFQLAKTASSPLVDAETLSFRRSICQECNYYSGSTSILKVACSRCGCVSLKLALSSQHCPLTPPKW